MGNNTTLHWYEYDNLQEHITEISQRSPMSATWTSIRNAIKDTAIVNKLMPPRFNRLSELSAALQSRLADWAMIPTCAYTAGTKRLELKLIFSAARVAGPDYAYIDDQHLVGQLDLQLAPAFDIITKYLEAPEVGTGVITLLDLPMPKHVQEMSRTGVFMKRYEWDAEKSAWKRKGMPFAASVYMYYAPFEL